MNIPSNTESSVGTTTFAPTRWTNVLSARGHSPEARSALSELCVCYYAPVLAFLRRSAYDEDLARELTQEFFARLLASQGVAGVDPKLGKFRSYLLGAVKHFLADKRDHDQRLKRGAGRPMESSDPGTDTSPGLQITDPNSRSPDREFDRKWALTVLDHALTTLAHEHRSAGKSEQFEALKPWLTGDSEDISQADAARQLGLNEGAVKVAIHRLRRRFREVIKMEISQTLAHPSDLEEELSSLFEALG